MNTRGEGNKNIATKGSKNAKFSILTNIFLSRLNLILGIIFSPWIYLKQETKTIVKKDYFDRWWTIAVSLKWLLRYWRGTKSGIIPAARRVIGVMNKENDSGEDLLKVNNKDNKIM